MEDLNSWSYRFNSLMDTLRCVAIDLGAGSCRVSLAEWDGTAAKVHLVHRYPNGPVERDGHLYWQLDRLCQGAEEGLRLSAELLPKGDDAIHSVGVDGWAVDYVRLDASGRPLGDPFCYRDPRTENAMPEVWARIGRERIYELTGIQFLRFNTLYQLYADRRDGLDPGARWLNIPEYLLYRFCGLDPATAVAEYTNATHTQLVGARTRYWCDEIFEQVGLDRSAAPRIVPPGTPLGPLRGDAASLPAFSATKVIAPACHDTGSAVAGIPDACRDWAFISSGTWSLVGAVLEEPCTSSSALRENFTNEGGVGGTFRFLKNVNGMWLLEECLREWQIAGGHSWALPELIAECKRRPAPKAVFNVDAAELILPGHMPSKINRELEKAGHEPLPEDAERAPGMANVIFASLAARYAEVLRALQEVTGRRFRRLYVVGGGSQNEYLNRLIAERTGLEVNLGPVEGSTLGNLAIQFAALESEEAKVTPPDVARWAARLVRSSSK
jgi:rhamnulokinase